VFSREDAIRAVCACSAAGELAYAESLAKELGLDNVCRRCGAAVDFSSRMWITVDARTRSEDVLVCFYCYRKHFFHFNGYSRRSHDER